MGNVYSGVSIESNRFYCEQDMRYDIWYHIHIEDSSPEQISTKWLYQPLFYHDITVPTVVILFVFLFDTSNSFLLIAWIVPSSVMISPNNESMQRLCPSIELDPRITSTCPCLWFSYYLSFRGACVSFRLQEMGVFAADATYSSQ